MHAEALFKDTESNSLGTRRSGSAYLRSAIAGFAANQARRGDGCSVGRLAGARPAGGLGTLRSGVASAPAATRAPRPRAAARY